MGQLAATALIAVFFAYLNTTKRQSYLLVWSCGWVMLVLHCLAVVLEPRLGLLPLFLADSQFSSGAAALAFLETARQYSGGPRRTGWLLGAGAVLAVWTYSCCFGELRSSPGIRDLPGTAGDGLDFLAGEPPPGHRN